jgi:cysteinyl-tRNA synthetase
MDGAETALNRLRNASHKLGDPGSIDPSYQEQFTARVNNDLNMPQALALAWDLVKSDLPAAAKKATLLAFDQVLGLRLGERHPAEETAIPEDIMALVEQRQQARVEKDWQQADGLRLQIAAAGFEVKDTAEGPQVRVVNR